MIAAWKIARHQPHGSFANLLRQKKPCMRQNVVPSDPMMFLGWIPYIAIHVHIQLLFLVKSQYCYIVEYPIYSSIFIIFYQELNPYIHLYPIVPLFLILLMVVFTHILLWIESQIRGETGLAGRATKLQGMDGALKMLGVRIISIG